MRIVFDGKVISKEAVLATCYWCAEKMVADVSLEGESVCVDLKGVGDYVMTDADIDDFKTMAIHNQLRHQLLSQFAALETAIVEKAFAPVRNRT